MADTTLTPDLLVGWIYEINPAAIVPSGRGGPDMTLYHPLMDNNIKYIAINGKTPQGSVVRYDIQTLDDTFNDKPLNGPIPGRPRETMRYATSALSTDAIPVVKKVKPSPQAETLFGSTELDKQRAALAHHISTREGLPVRPALKNILDYAGLTEVRPTFAGRKKTRKSKKSKRKTHGRKRV